MLQVEVLGLPVMERKIPASDAVPAQDGKPAKAARAATTRRSQHALMHGHDAGNLPSRIVVPVGEGDSPYKPGFYCFPIGAIVVNGYGSPEFAKFADGKLVPVDEVTAGSYLKAA